jgi:hypothetical protein
MIIWEGFKEFEDEVSVEKKMNTEREKERKSAEG